jgi:hypothetical protein
MSFTLLTPKSVHSTVGYSHAARLGDLLFVSGQVPKNEHDETVYVGDAERQTEVVYENLKRVLEESGSGLDMIGQGQRMKDCGPIKRSPRLIQRLSGLGFPGRKLVTSIKIFPRIRTCVVSCVAPGVAPMKVGAAFLMRQGRPDLGALGDEVGPPVAEEVRKVRTGFLLLQHVFDQVGRGFRAADLNETPAH